MNAIPQHILDRQLAALNAMAATQATLFSGFEKLVNLNMRVAKATLEEVTQASQQAAGVKDAQEAAAFTSALAQPSAEKAMAYSKHVFDILSGVQGDLSKLAEAHIADGQQQMADAVEQFSKNAPAGTEGTVAFLKSSLATANGAYESLSKAAKQAADAAGANLNAATTATFKAATDAAEAAGKTARAARA